MLTLASVGQKLIAFLYFALVARTIGDEATGAYFIALALITTIGVLDDLGLTSVVIREVAKTPEAAKGYLQNVIGIKLITMPLTVALAYMLPIWQGFETQTAVLVQLAIIIMLFDTLSVSMYGVLRGLHKLKYESLGIFVGQSLTAVVGGMALLSGSQDLRLLVVALIVGSGWNMVFSVTQVIKYVGWDALRPAYTQTWPLLRMSFMFFLAAVFVKIYSYVDSFTIQAVLGQAAVGVYAVAYKFTYAFQFLPLAFVGALYPAMSALVDKPKDLNTTLLKAEWYLSLLVTPIVFGIFALAPEIIDMFYGERFAAAGPVLGVLIFALIFIFLDFPLGSLLNATGRQAWKTAFMGGAMLVNVIGNLLLVPKLGIMGAAVTALITFTLLFTAGWVSIMYLTKIRLIDLIRTIGGFYAAGAVMAIVVLFLKQLVFWPFTIPVGAGVFIGLSVMMGMINRGHVNQIMQILRPFRYAKNSVANN
jgi:O-antigen/teichoic acid export membrane protein